MKILIIEDEEVLLENIHHYLRKQGYACETASNYWDGNHKIVSYEYECIVLDLNLPDGNGLNLLHKLKEIKSKAGVLIISARNSLEDRIKGLELGADDYLSKPFHLSELNARIHALLRRKTSHGENFIQFMEIHLNYDQRRVLVKGNLADLTDKEFRLLEYFIINQRIVLTKAAIAEHGWGDEYDQVDNFDFIYTHIKNLRKKLISMGAKDYIQTVYGIGYRFSN